MNVFLDTETTGLPSKDANWKTDYMRFPYMVQLSWKCSNEDTVHDYIIKPEGYNIPINSTKIHSISTAKALNEGIDMPIVLLELLKYCCIADKIIGHNLYFDISIIKANYLRLCKGSIIGLEALNNTLHKSKRIDTMMKTIKYCSIKQPNSKRFKYPTLTELHKKLFNCSFDAHNSKEDVLATERCFNELVKLRII